MKVVSSIVSLVLVIIMVSSLTQGYAAPRITFQPADNQVLQVWFDALPQLTTSNPLAYLFNVEAKTSSGLWITSLHWDFGDGSTLDVPFSGQSQISEIRAHIYANQANYCVSVTASDSAGNTGTASISIRPDFTLNASPSPQNVMQGVSVTYTVNVRGYCGRQVFVKLTTSLNQNAPDGLSWKLDPTSGNTPFTSTLSVQTSLNTPFGTYVFSIIGTGAGNTHTATVTLIVTTPPPPYFTISVYPPSIVVTAQVRTNTTTVTIQPFNGFNSPVNLTATGNPSGMDVSFPVNPVPVPANGVGTSQAIITVACSVTPGTYAIQITGRSNNPSQVSSSYVSVQVAACAPPFPWWLIFGLILGLVVVLVMVILVRKQKTSLVPVPLLIQQVVYCPTCGRPMLFIEQYRRWYCSYC